MSIESCGVAATLSIWSHWSSWWKSAVRLIKLEISYSTKYFVIINVSFYSQTAIPIISFNTISYRYVNRYRLHNRDIIYRSAQIRDSQIIKWNWKGGACAYVRVELLHRQCVHPRTNRSRYRQEFRDSLTRWMGLRGSSDVIWRRWEPSAAHESDTYICAISLHVALAPLLHRRFSISRISHVSIQYRLTERNATDFLSAFAYPRVLHRS